MMTVIAKRPANVGNALNQAVIGNSDVGPNLRKEILPAGQLALPGKQRLQDRKRLWAQRDRPALIIRQDL